MVGRVGRRGKGCVFPWRPSYIILIFKFFSLLFVAKNGCTQIVEK